MNYSQIHLFVYVYKQVDKRHLVVVYLAEDCAVFIVLRAVCLEQNRTKAIIYIQKLRHLPRVDTVCQHIAVLCLLICKAERAVYLFIFTDKLQNLCFPVIIARRYYDGKLMVKTEYLIHFLLCNRAFDWFFHLFARNVKRVLAHTRKHRAHRYDSYEYIRHNMSDLHNNVAPFVNARHKRFMRGLVNMLREVQ